MGERRWARARLAVVSKSCTWRILPFLEPMPLSMAKIVPLILPTTIGEKRTPEADCRFRKWRRNKQSSGSGRFTRTLRLPTPFQNSHPPATRGMTKDRNAPFFILPFIGRRLPFWTTSSGLLPRRRGQAVRGAGFDIQRVGGMGQLIDL